MSLSLFVVYLVNGLFLAGMVYLAAQLIKNETLKKYYYPALIIKFFCTVAIGLLYTQFYQGGDITVFFEAAKTLSLMPFSEYWQEITASTLPTDSQRSIYFSRIVSVVLVLTKSDFWLASIYFSLVSFYGSFYFITQLSKIFPALTLPAIISLLFFPSIVFWSSGVIKEALVFGCFLFFIGFVLKAIHSIKFKWYEVPVAILSLLLLIILKYYIAGVLIPCLTLYLLVHIRQYFNLVKWLGFAFGLVVLVLFSLQFMHPNLNLNLFFHAMHIARNTLIENSRPEAIVQLYSGSNIILEGGINFFILLFSGIFRPAIFESLQFPNILAGLENTVLLFLFISRFFGRFTINKKDLAIISIVLIYILTLAFFLTYSTPNFGTLSRFKIYYMPFFLMLILKDHPLLKSKNISILSFRRRRNLRNSH